MNRPEQDKGTGRPAPRDDEGAIREPPNSTVDDWLGQQVDADAELAEELLDETEGDPEEAERRFAERTHVDRPDHLPTEERRT
ncbi:MAG TPA: hypothetical protein VF743_02390 [Acidimicrobiales bacterium]